VGEISGEAAMKMAAGNAARLWRVLAGARGHHFSDHGSFVAADAGTRQGGLRVIRRDPRHAQDDNSKIGRLVGPHAVRALVEDPFGHLDLTRMGLVGRPLPVMLLDCRPGHWTEVPGVEVRRAADAAALAAAEEAIATGFPMHVFLPFRRGAMLPPGLLGSHRISVFLALRGGEPAGGCITLSADGDGGIYSLATLPGHRSRGVGRALMHAGLRHLAPSPVTLVATRDGVPLYRSLGFRTVGHSTWWRVRS
jgi:ribosomal protein S18 acetylase RimI-like enzyme